ncbi:uncharacterized protein LOC117329551 isoform X2 [Pecten maximus]|uniref:uncharacterized protein LOC117329551 isoform X2 n=1 Tax=Pecten maximus TaxID=6579 RepID=UPI0014582B38|nr:uncharacterized protein LOC117329551 isoform X2 [Pecten maximus]
MPSAWRAIIKDTTDEEPSSPLQDNVGLTGTAGLIRTKAMTRHIKPVYNSDSDSSDVCGLRENMQGTWIGLSADNSDTDDRVVVDGDNIEVTIQGFTSEFTCVDKGLFYGEFLWKSKDVDDSYVCVLKTDVGESDVTRKLATSTGTFEPIPIPEKTDLEYTSLCTNTIAEDVLNLRRQWSK